MSTRISTKYIVPVAPTSGNANRWRRWRDWAESRSKRYSFTLGATAALLILLLLLSWAAFDIFRAVRHKDEQLQVAGLRTQLVEFLLTTTREPDGSSLLDNPVDYAQARRTLKIATVGKPFFGSIWIMALARYTGVDSSA